MTNDFEVEMGPEEFGGEEWDGGEDWVVELGVIATAEELAQHPDVNRDEWAGLAHDSIGERYVHVTALSERGGAVTLRRVLGIMQYEVSEGLQFFIGTSQVTADHTLSPGDEVYMVGKLAGGR